MSANANPAMSDFLMKRSRTIYASQQARCRSNFGYSLPYTLDELRERVIIPEVAVPTCIYCDLIVISESHFAIDHIRPLVRGGSWEIDNLVLCCPACNIVKGALTADEFLELRHAVRDWDIYAQTDLFRRMKIGANPMAARMLAGPGRK